MFQFLQVNPKELRDESSFIVLEDEGKSSIDEEAVRGFGDIVEKMEFEVTDQDVKLVLLEDSDSAMTDQGPQEIVSNETKLSLTPDMRFRDWASFEDHFEAWKAQNWTHTYKRDTRPNKTGNSDTHKYSSANINCVHYGLPRIRTTRFIRKNQSYMGRGCAFDIHVKLDPVANEYFFHKFVVEHKNHEVSKEAYMSHPRGRRLSGREVEKYVADYLITMKVSKAVLKKRIYAETGK